MGGAKTTTMDTLDQCADKLDNFAKIMNRWEEVLNSDEELAERNTSIYSSLEGKTAISIEVEGLPSYLVDVKKGKFKVYQGSAESALLDWKLPAGLFKEVMLGKQRLIYSLLDPQGTLAFDTHHFTHWNGASVIEMLFLACEMGRTDKGISKLVEGLAT